MGHAIWLPAPPRGCNVQAQNPDGSKLGTCAREGRRLSSDIDARAHQTIEQDVQAVREAQLEGEETRTPTITDEQTAAPDNPSFCNTFPSLATPADSEATAPSPEQPQELAQPRRSTRTHKSSCIEHDYQSEQVVQHGTNAPRLAPSLQAPGAFAKDPDEAGGATTLEDGAPAPLVDPGGTQLTFTAKIADAGAPDPRTLAEATRTGSPDSPPWEKTIEEQPHAHKARPVAQGFSQMSGVDTHAKVACVTANLGNAHWEAVEWTLHHLSGIPDPLPTHVEASRPPEGHSNANPDGNMAKYRRAISWHASLTDSAAVLWSSKRQDIAPSDSVTTEGNDTAATYRTTFSHTNSSTAVGWRGRRSLSMAVLLGTSCMARTTLPLDNQVADALTKALPSVTVRSPCIASRLYCSELLWSRNMVSSAARGLVEVRGCGITLGHSPSKDCHGS